MNLDYVSVTIYDNNKNIITPDEVTSVDANNVDIDLSSYAAITGTWRILVIADVGTTVVVGPTGPAGSSYTRSFVNADLTAGILTVGHSLGSKYIIMSVYDNNDKLVDPDEIITTDTNNTSLDLSSYIPLTGTWNLKIVT